MKQILKKLSHKLLGNNFQKLENYFYFLPQAMFWNLRYGFPSRKLKIIGVTGTDGKTTTSNMIYHILTHLQSSTDSSKEENFKVGMVSTISAKIGEQDLDTGFHVTSPDPKDIQKYLKMMVDRGIEYVVLETTSHALDQFRYWGIKFDFAVYTNITQDHFDYHKNYENYLTAKLKLIDNLKEDGVVIANADDKSYEFIQKKFVSQVKSGNKLGLISYGIEKGMNNAKNIETNLEGIGFKFFRKDQEIEDYQEYDEELKMNLCLHKVHDVVTDIKFNIPMIGNYNVYNSLAAISVCENMKINLSNIADLLSTFTSLSGRMEIIQKGDSIKSMIIVDFAHTPNALEKALSTLNELRKPLSSQQASTPSPRKELSRLIVVFGCAGLRDSSKRPMMGEVAARLADSIIVVPEDPRTESLKDINDQIISGMQQPSVLQSSTASPKDSTNYKEALKEIYRFDEPEVKSRELGIAKAIEIAKPQDIIVICGKGHEKSLCFGTTEYPYSDQEVVRKLIK